MALAHELAKKFIEQLDGLHETKKDELTIGDIDGLFKHLKGQERDKLYEGIQEIAGKIEKVRVEISDPPHPDKISGDIIPDANLQLDAVVKATENATNQILDSVEKIQAAAGALEGEAGEKIIAEVTKIFEASNFQDITGQRIRKVLNTLVDIEKSIKSLMEAISGKIEISVIDVGKKDEDPDKALMSGPQLEEDKPSQDDIDKLFSEA